MVAGPRIGVLALQGDVREHVGALDAAGARTCTVRRAGELASVDGLVIPGGESTTMGRLLRVTELVEPLRARVAAGMPAYGSCAGMILLAAEVLDTRPHTDAVGSMGHAAMDISVRRNAFGRQVDSFETDLDVAAIGGGPVRGVFIRAPWVERTGQGVRVLARVPAGHGAASGRAVAVVQGPLLATSFHPEMTGDGRVHEMFVRTVRQYS